MSWFFEEHGTWTRFDASGEKEVEKAFQKNRPTAQSSFFNPRLQQSIVYQYDLSAMTQTNTTTGYIRRIKRELPGGAGSGGGAASVVPHKKHQPKKARGAHTSAQTTILEYKAPGDTPGGAAGPVPDFAAVTGFKTIDASGLGKDDLCCICMDSFAQQGADASAGGAGGGDDPCIRLSNCNGHYFHRSCIDNPMCFKQGWIKCPVCKTTYGQQLGPQPSGTMTIVLRTDSPCDGHADSGTWQIQYTFPSGKQTASMPNPGAAYEGTSRTAYIPDTSDGRQVLELFKTAFTRGLTFQVGTSVTTGRQDTTVWNGIHHKTHTHGGSSNFGYPDETYFDRVKDELDQKGVR